MFDECHDLSSHKRQKFDNIEFEIDPFSSPKRISSPNNGCSSPNLLKRWRKGDEIFKGKFSAGVTPKLVRTLKQIEKPEPQILFNSQPEKDPGHYGANPFLSITPQVRYKARAMSFHRDSDTNDGNMCVSPKSSTRPKYAETPMPMKSMLTIPKFDPDAGDSDEENERIAQAFIKKYNSRGSRFDEDFEEINVIGRGHFGSVIRCRNKLDGIEYAIKITDKSTPKHKNSLVEAMQEVYALSALSASSENPYVIRYFRGWVENDQLYIQMELCDRSLFDLFESNEYDEKEIYKLLRHICLGLNELHQKDIVHLDLKLENILISASGKYKLGDLGFSRLINKLSHNVPEGDTRYLAQELLNDNPDAPLPDLRKADIFSLGILTYELVERRRVLSKGPEWHDLREGRINFTHPESISEELQEMIRLMLSPNPENRPTTSNLLKTYLLSDEEKELKLSRNIIKYLMRECYSLKKQLEAFSPSIQ